MNKLVKLAIFVGLLGATMSNPRWQFVPDNITKRDSFEKDEKGVEIGNEMGSDLNIIIPEKYKTLAEEKFRERQEKMSAREIQEQQEEEVMMRKEELAEEQGIIINGSTVTMPWGTYQALTGHLRLAREQRDAARRACRETRGCIPPTKTPR